MIQKSELQSLISKYFLNGLVESVKWVTEDKTLNIDFNTPNEEAIGSIVYNSFPLEDSMIGISDTSKLNKLLAITTGLIDINLTKTNKVFTKINLADTNYTLEFPLGDILLNQFKDPKKLAGDFEYQLECDLSKEIVDNIIKAKSALDSETVVFHIGTNFDGDSVLELKFGENSSHSNKISYIIPEVDLSGVIGSFELPFNSEILKSVLNNNKDFTTASMSLNTNGLIKFDFSGENWTSTYHLLRKANL